MRILQRKSLALPFVLPSLMSLPQVMAAQSGLPALSDTAGANKPAGLTTTSAKPTKAAAKTTTKTKSAAATSGPAVSNPSKLPGLTTSTGSDGLITGLPKLAGDDYPPPTVPPTAGAPFMRKSNLPEGTVFICVGAAIAFIALVILAWRGLVAWSLHRSVRRAAVAQSSKYAFAGDNKRRYSHGKPLASPFYTPGPGSTLSLDQLGASSKGASSKPPSAHGSLFFSPTAGAGMHTPANRGSGYLPAGYYAAGNSAAGGGSGMTHLGNTNGISLSNLNPGAQNNRYSRARSIGPSPPASPSLPPSRGNDLRPNTANLSTTALAGAASNSSLNVNMTAESRAPSAYLEELFENAVNTDSGAAPVAIQEKASEEKPERRERRRSKGYTDSPRRKSRSGHGHGHNTSDRRSRGY